MLQIKWSVTIFMQDKPEWYCTVQSSQLLSSCWDNGMSQSHPRCQGKGTQKEMLQHIPGLADLGMKCVRHSPEVQNRHSGKSQGNSEWALVPKCKMLLFGQFQRLFWRIRMGFWFWFWFSLKKKESILGILNICHDST